MTTIKMFEKPLGMRDTFPSTYEQLLKVRTIGREFLKSKGYQFIKTPTLEYYDTVGKASAITDHTLFKLVDSQGNTLVLRPDMTTPIARVATSKLLKEKIPQRLAYFASVYRAQQLEGGRAAEFEQMGVELIGDASVYSDVEMILTAVELLKQLEIDSFKVSIGHAGILQRVLEKYLSTPEQVEEIRVLLVDKNYVGVQEAIEKMSDLQGDALLQFIDSALSSTTLEQLEQFIEDDEDYMEMQTLSKILMQSNAANYISFDFTNTSHMNYYTGMLFEVYASGSGFPIGNGGRYDGLLETFGQNVGATGFSFQVDRLLEVKQFETSAKQKVVLLFDEVNYQEAQAKATELREQGSIVTLQFIGSLQDEQSFTSQFDEAIYFIQEDQAK